MQSIAPLFQDFLNIVVYVLTSCTCLKLVAILFNF